MGKSLRDRATREWSLLHVSTLRASVAFAALLLAGCESRVEPCEGVYSCNVEGVNG